MLAKRVKDYVTGGWAILTVTSRRTGNHYTYRIRNADIVGEEVERRFVDVLTGPHNESDYSWLGTLREGKYYHGRRSDIEYAAPSATVWRWMWERVRVGRYEVVDSQVDIEHADHCSVCRRLLTDPTSIEYGIGPICRKKRGLQ